MKTIGLWLVVLGAGFCSGAPITRVADARGCVNQNEIYRCGQSGTGTGNFVTGFSGAEPGSPTQNEELRSFFRFDLTGISGTVLSADFQVELPTGGYRSTDTLETFALFDILGHPADLTPSPLPVGTFADLGTGTLFGSGTVAFSNEGTLLTLSLNAAAVAEINGSLGGTFAMGGAVTSLARQTDETEFVWANSAGKVTAQLVLGFDAAPEPTAVPEPGTGLLLVAGLGVLAFWRGR